MMTKTNAQLDREDFQIQLEAAQESFNAGRFGSARGELNGALLIMDTVEKRNAKRLIEAAPEMYAALKELSQMKVAGVPLDEYEGHYGDTLRAAIAKAEQR